MSEKSERQRKAVALRLKGRNYREIYISLGYNSVDEAREDVEKYANEFLDEEWPDHSSSKVLASGTVWSIWFAADRIFDVIVESVEEDRVRFRFSSLEQPREMPVSKFLSLWLKAEEFENMRKENS